MKRRSFIQLAGASALTGMVARPALAQAATVRWWYHFDNPQNTPAELVAKFERENPGIKIQAEAIPWGGGNDYSTRLFASIVAGNAPDCAQVKLNNHARLQEMDALAPLDDLLKSWPGRTDIAESIWTLNRASNGRQYYLPLHYVVLYLYYRADMLDAAGLKPPKTFDEFLAVAKATTRDNTFGFGMRGGAGGQDNWGAFVLGGGASFSKGGMVTEKALAANRWYVALAREHKVTPPSAPTDGFRQIVDGFKAGRSAMIIHHVGSSNDMVATFGDKVSAVPVPTLPGTPGWTQFGDESNAVFASSRNKEAAFRWISFLSTGENNAALAKLSGQLPIAGAAAASWTGHQKRFVDASVASLPIAGVLPDSPKTADFATTVWPQTMQRALLGQVTPDDMMRTFEKHYHG
jgi:multiple sugar transport system substrate-binding protein